MERTVPLAISWLMIASVLIGCGSRDAEVATTGQAGAETTTTDSVAPSCTPATTEAPPPTITTTDRPGVSTTTAPTPTTASTTTTTAPPPAPLVPGDEGPDVVALQQRLSDLGYWLGEHDGRYGSSTSHAVTAFQKAQGLERDGVAGVGVREQLAVATPPTARSTSGRVIEVDLGRQVLLVVTDGHVDTVLDTATGTAATPTPPGHYAVYREIDGYRHAPLGTLYRPKYFNGGIAIHGSTSVPTQPASHGCIRVTYPAMDHLWNTGLVPLGTPVWVY